MFSILGIQLFIYSPSLAIHQQENRNIQVAE